MSNPIRLGLSPLTKNAYVARMKDNGRYLEVTGNKTDVTTDFKRCVVNYCSEVVEFEVDGMKFKATCERID